ncbi:MAG: hypothetical protein AAGF12_16820 [Myxococcota bacterium]
MKGREIEAPKGQVVAEVVAEAPFSAMRAALVSSGRGWLRERGLFDAYLAPLPPEARTVIETAAASDMLPLTVLRAHYRSMDALRLSIEDQRASGRHIGKENWGAMMKVVATLAGRMGASPWIALSRAPQIFARNVTGGGLRAERLTGTRARIVLSQFEISRSEYFVHSVIGSFLAGLDPFCEADARITDRDGVSFSFTIDW